MNSLNRVNRTHPEKSPARDFLASINYPCDK